MSINNSVSITAGGNSTIKQMFYKEGESMLESAKKCEELWAEMRKADFRKEGVLNEKNIQLIYEKKKGIINELLKVSSAEEFLEVFDDDCVT